MITNKVGICDHFMFGNILLVNELDGVGRDNTISNTLRKASKFISKGFGPDCTIGSGKECIHRHFLTVVVEDMI